MKKHRRQAPPRKVDFTNLSDEHLLSSAEVAELLGVRETTLPLWRYTGQGPTHVKLGRRLVRYRVGDLRAYIAGQQSPRPVDEHAKQRMIAESGMF